MAKVKLGQWQIREHEGHEGTQREAIFENVKIRGEHDT
jgi:hypothetical protein